MRYHEIIAEGRDAYIFHGTDLIGAIGIIRNNEIFASQQYEHHTTGVSFTRDYRFAREVGTWGERQCPVVFVVDQNRIAQSKMKIAPYRDTDDQKKLRARESEELVQGSVKPLDKYLVSVNVDLDHLQAALRSQDYWRWMADERFEPFLTTRSVFLRMIDRYVVHHPLLNRWVPRVTHVPGTKHEGKPYLPPDTTTIEEPDHLDEMSRIGRGTPRLKHFRNDSAGNWNGFTYRGLQLVVTYKEKGNLINKSFSTEDEATAFAEKLKAEGYKQVVQHSH